MTHTEARILTIFTSCECRNTCRNFYWTLRTRFHYLLLSIYFLFIKRELPIPLNCLCKYINVSSLHSWLYKQTCYTLQQMCILSGIRQRLRTMHATLLSSKRWYLSYNVLWWSHYFMDKRWHKINTKNPVTPVIYL